MHKSTAIVVILLLGTACDSTDPPGGVTVDPVGHSCFYVINQTADSIAVRMVEDGHYPRTISDSTFRIGSNDTAFIATYSAFTPPTPTECFDTAYISSPVLQTPVALAVDNDSLWSMVWMDAGYPPTAAWYFGYRAN